MPAAASGGEAKSPASIAAADDINSRRLQPVIDRLIMGFAAQLICPRPSAGQAISSIIAPGEPIDLASHCQTVCKTAFSGAPEP